MTTPPVFPPEALTLTQALPPSRTRAVLIDLDGTMVHTAPDIVEAVSRMLADFDQPPLPFDTVSSFIGKGVPNLVKRTLETAALDGRVDMDAHSRCLIGTIGRRMGASVMFIRTSPQVFASWRGSAIGSRA